MYVTQIYKQFLTFTLQCLSIQVPNLDTVNKIKMLRFNQPKENFTPSIQVAFDFGFVDMCRTTVDLTDAN